MDGNGVIRELGVENHLPEGQFGATIADPT
jgi:hypothetical protein